MYIKNKVLEKMALANSLSINAQRIMAKRNTGGGGDDSNYVKFDENGFLVLSKDNVDEILLGTSGMNRVAVITESEEIPNEIVAYLSDLDLPTVLQADFTKYQLSHIKLITIGHGNQVGDIITIKLFPGTANETTTTVTVESVDGNGGALTIVENDLLHVYEVDPKLEVAPMDSTTGTGEDVVFQVFSRYADGTQIDNGTLWYVPEQDPLAQQSYVGAQIQHYSRILTANDEANAIVLSNENPNNLVVVPVP